MVKLWTGDECGLIKEYNDNTKKVVLVNADLSEMDRSQGIVGLVRPTPTTVAAQLLNGAVHLYNSETRQREHEYASVWTTEDDEQAVGIHALEDTLCSCSIKGTVVLRRGDTVLHQFPAFPKKQQQENTKKAAATVVVSAHAVSQGNNWIALGGQDRDMVVYDVQTQAPTWKAKNLPPDPQTLLQPRVYPSAACFLQGDNNLLAVGTAHHEIRLYDIRTQRRPIAHTTLHSRPFRVTSVTPCQEQSTLVVGDAAGYVSLLDARKLTEKGRLVGPAGSIRGMVATSSKVFVAGLDRHMRGYTTTTRKQTDTVYLKQRLNCILVVNEEDEADEEVVTEETAEGDPNQEDKVEDYVDSSADDEDDSSSDDEESEEEDVQESNARRKRQRAS